MKVYETLRHTTWECRYHVVFIPKCRRKALDGQLRQELGKVFRELGEQKECEIEEGHLTFTPGSAFPQTGTLPAFCKTM